MDLTYPKTVEKYARGPQPALPESQPKYLQEELRKLEVAIASLREAYLASDISPGVITTAKLADSSVTTAKIVDANVTTAKIADLSVTTAKIADSNVTTAKIADANITQAKLAVGVGANGPTFAATMSAAQTITTTTATKVAFNTKTFDTNTNFNTTTYRFTPTVAGYYQVNFVVGLSATSQTDAYGAIYKNGTVYMRGGAATASSSVYSSSGSAVISMNGTTDYLEIYAYSVGTTPSVTTNSQFSAIFVRPL